MRVQGQVHPSYVLTGHPEKAYSSEPSLGAALGPSLLGSPPACDVPGLESPAGLGSICVSKTDIQMCGLRVFRLLHQNVCAGPELSHQAPSPEGSWPSHFVPKWQKRQASVLSLSIKALSHPRGLHLPDLVTSKGPTS